MSVAQQTEEEVNIGGGIPPEEYHLPQRENSMTNTRF
jgi:hypothetical protein